MRIRTAMTVGSDVVRPLTLSRHMFLSPPLRTRHESHGSALPKFSITACSVLSIETNTTARKTTLTMMMITTTIPRHWTATAFWTLLYACFAVTVLTLPLCEGNLELLCDLPSSLNSALMYTRIQYPKVANCKIVDTAAKASSGPQ